MNSKSSNFKTELKNMTAKLRAKKAFQKIVLDIENPKDKTKIYYTHCPDSLFSKYLDELLRNSGLIYSSGICYEDNDFEKPYNMLIFEVSNQNYVLPYLKRKKRK